MARSRVSHLCDKSVRPAKPGHTDSRVMASQQDSEQPKRGSSARRRRAARQKAMQALYQWDFDRDAHSPETIVNQFCDLQNMTRVDTEYFVDLFNYATRHIDEIDGQIGVHLDREINQLDPVERSVLRICCAELNDQPGTPYKVVVNEALEIAKDFGADKGFRYINGIADKLAASLRKKEYAQFQTEDKPASSKQVDVPVADRVRQQGSDKQVKITIRERQVPEKANKEKANKEKTNGEKTNKEKMSREKIGQKAGSNARMSAPGSVHGEPAAAKRKKSPDADDNESQ